MTAITALSSATTPALRRNTIHVVARLRRLFKHWAAATTAYHEQQARLCALHRLQGREPTRIYRGPLDSAVEKAAELRKRR
jgi:hypothetical protein